MEKGSYGGPSAKAIRAWSGESSAAAIHGRGQILGG